MSGNGHLEQEGRGGNDTNRAPSTTSTEEELFLGGHEDLRMNPWTQRIQRTLEHVDRVLPSRDNLQFQIADPGTGDHDQARTPHNLELTAERLRQLIDASETRRPRSHTNDSTRVHLGSPRSPRRRQVRASQSEPTFGRARPDAPNGWVPPWWLNESGTPREAQDDRRQ